MYYLKEFLESSTIHGLAFISTAPAKVSKLFWLTVVVFGFFIAAYLINGSYEDWQASPIATSISTHPISELDFPTITVCPPEGSNTALNYDLARARNIPLTDKDRQNLINSTQDMLIDKPSYEFVKLARALTCEEDILELFEDKPGRTLPLPYPLPDMDPSDNTLGYEVLSSQLNGCFKTPRFGEKISCNKSFDKIHFVLLLPLVVMKKASNNDNLKIKIEVKTNDDWLVQYREGSKYRNYRKKPSIEWAEAESLCRGKNGQLASVQNVLDLKEINPRIPVVKGPRSWIGATDIEVEDLWTWTVGNGCHLGDFWAILFIAKAMCIVHPWY